MLHFLKERVDIQFSLEYAFFSPVIVKTHRILMFSSHVIEILLKLLFILSQLFFLLPYVHFLLSLPGFLQVFFCVQIKRIQLLRITGLFVSIILLSLAYVVHNSHKSLKMPLLDFFSVNQSRKPFFLILLILFPACLHT